MVQDMSIPSGFYLCYTNLWLVIFKKFETESLFRERENVAVARQAQIKGVFFGVYNFAIHQSRVTLRAIVDFQTTFEENS